MLDEERVLGVETGSCPHTAVREDPSMNLAALAELDSRFPEAHYFMGLIHLRQSEFELAASEFRSELEVDALGDRRFLEHGEVKVHDPLLTQRGIDTRLVAEAVCAGSSEACSIEPSTDS